MTPIPLLLLAFAAAPPFFGHDIAGVRPEGPPAESVPAESVPAESAPAEPVPAAGSAAPPPAAEPSAAPELGLIEAPGQERLVAVLDLKTEGDVGALANALATVMAIDISARPALKAVSRNELKSLLAHAADASLLGCDSAACAGDIAKLVDAQLVIAGTLGLVPVAEPGGVRPLVLTLSLIDPNGPAIVQRADLSWRGPPEELVSAVRPLLDKLFDGPAAASYVGGIELFAPEGTTLVIDGKEVGKAPLKEPVRDLAIGVHVVEATAAGFVPLRRDVVVSRNETSVVRVTLEEEPYWTQWWFWTAVGGGAAVAVTAGTTIALLALSQETPPTRVVVKAPLPTTSAVLP
jgi:hypothetical protein